MNVRHDIVPTRLFARTWEERTNIAMLQGHITVIGGSNLDIKGYPLQALIAATSNPGRVTLCAGGVGRNIAHNLALLGVPVALVSAIGDDHFGQFVLTETRRAGVDVTAVQVLPGHVTGVYLAVQDASRDLAVAISDMAATAAITPATIHAQAALLRESRLAILETNLDLATLQAAVTLCRDAGVPIMIEPVSVAKARKLRDIPDVIDYVTPNLAELNALAQNDAGDVAQRCQQLAGKFRHVFVKMGARGVWHDQADRKQGALYEPLPTHVVDVNGAGDAFVAGLACGVFRALDNAAAIRLGLAAAHLTLQTSETVNREVSFEHCCDLLNLSL